ncbi:MAG: hypothetical protein KF873_08625 [Gemmataceae bacterium]|nr:hypothetical protein [Gemmataceae bacterium]
MPLRDHFRPPLSEQFSWDLFHGQWPAMIVLELGRWLPPNFYAGPSVRLGSGVEVDIAAFESVGIPAPPQPGPVPVLQPLPESNLVVVADYPSPDEYEVRVYDSAKGRKLVAAIELVSPSNKDRPEHRREFVAKCASLLRQDVSVSIVDVVTVRPFNLYLDLLDFFGQDDPGFASRDTSLYAVTCTGTRVGSRMKIQAWTHTLGVGQALPALPIILGQDIGLNLNLETTYEDTRRALRIP